MPTQVLLGRDDAPDIKVLVLTLTTAGKQNFALADKIGASINMPLRNVAMTAKEVVQCHSFFIQFTHRIPRSLTAHLLAPHRAHLSGSPLLLFVTKYKRKPLEVPFDQHLLTSFKRLVLSQTKQKTAI